MNLNVDKSQWTKVRLGDVATEYSSRINDPSSGDRERFVGSSCIGQWDFRVQEWESTASVTSAMKLFEEGDYLLVRRSLYASDFRERAPRAHFAGVCSGDILTIRENPEFIADGFLIGILNNPSIWSYIVANASGSITRRIKWKDLANYEFLLPPKHQQAEIAELLWALDDMDMSQKALHKANDLLRQSAIKSRFSFSSNPEAVVDDHKWSELGWIPKSGEILRQGDVAEFVNGRAYKKEEWEDEGVPVIRLQNLTGSGSTFYYSTLDLPEEKYCYQGDLLYMWSASFGAVYWNGPKAIFHYHIWKVVCDEEKMLPDYMYYNLTEVTRRMMNQVSGSTMPHITKGGMEKLPIMVPDMDIQIEAVSLMRKIDDRSEEIKLVIHHTEVLKKSIVNSVFGNVQ